MMANKELLNEKEMTDDDLHAALLRYNPEYKKKNGSLNENERQIRLKQLHHFQARERKELEAKEKEAKQKEKEALKREREQKRTGRESMNASQLISNTDIVAFQKSNESDSQKLGAAETEEPPKNTQVKRRGRKTLNMSDIVTPSVMESAAVEELDSTKNLENKTASNVQASTQNEKPTRAGRAQKRGMVTLGSADEVLETSEQPQAKKSRGAAGKRKSTVPLIQELKEADKMLSTIKEVDEPTNLSPPGVLTPPEKTFKQNGVTDHSSGGIQVFATDVTLGRAAQNLTVHLYKQDNKLNWNHLCESKTGARGGSNELLSASQFTRGLYKLQCDTGSYYKQLNILPVFKTIEVSFEVTSPAENYEIGLDIGEHHYNTRISRV